MPSTTTADLVRVLLSLQRDRATAAVEVAAEGIRTFIYVRKGKAVFAEQGTLGETLGRLLVDQGRLSPAEYSRVIERMTQRLIESEQLRLGEVVVELGFMTIEQVQEALADQVRRKIARCFSWEVVDVDVRLDPELLAGAGQFPCSIEPLVLEGVRRFFDARRIDGLLGPIDAWYLVPAEDPIHVGERFGLRGPELRWIERLDGSRTTSEMIAGAKGLEPAPILAALLLADLVAPSLEAAPRRSVPEAATPPVRIASPAEARAVAPAPAPRREPEPKTASRVEPATAASARPVSQPPDSRRARIEAEQAFQKGLADLRANHLARAAKELSEASRLFPEAAEYKLYAAWAAFRATDDAEALQRKRPALRTIATSALRQDRGLAVGHYILGHLALLDDDEPSAERFFKNALKLDPTNVDAERHVRLLARRSRPR